MHKIRRRDTTHGDATIIPDICTVPCPGQATVNTKSRFSVLAHCELLRCPNMKVVADTSLRWIDVTWLPFEITVRFDGEGKVMMADGRHLMKSMRLYKERCESMFKDFLIEAAKGTTHTQLMQALPFGRKNLEDEDSMAGLLEYSSDEYEDEHTGKTKYMNFYLKKPSTVPVERSKALAWAAKVVGKDPKTANWKKHRK